MITSPGGDLWSPPIWVDFMHLDWEGRVRLDFPGTQRDLDRFKLELHDGRPIVLYEEDANDLGQIDDLVALGLARFDEDEGRWVAEAWEPTVHVSELDPNSRRLYLEFRPMNAS